MSTPREPDTADKQSRIRSYLQERYPAGYTIEPGVDTKLTHLLFRVRDPDGKRIGLLALVEEFWMNTGARSKKNSTPEM